MVLLPTNPKILQSSLCPLIPSPMISTKKKYAQGSKGNGKNVTISGPVLKFQCRDIWLARLENVTW